MVLPPGSHRFPDGRLDRPGILGLPLLTRPELPLTNVFLRKRAFIGRLIFAAQPKGRAGFEPADLPQERGCNPPIFASLPPTQRISAASGCWGALLTGSARSVDDPYASAALWGVWLLCPSRVITG